MADEVAKVLGPGAVGDPEDPDKRITADEVEGYTVQEIEEGLTSGALTVEQVREAEDARKTPRKSVQRLLEAAEQQSQQTQAGSSGATTEA